MRLLGTEKLTECVNAADSSFLYFTFDISSHTHVTDMGVFTTALFFLLLNELIFSLFFLNIPAELQIIVSCNIVSKNVLAR